MYKTELKNHAGCVAGAMETETISKNVANLKNRMDKVNIRLLTVLFICTAILGLTACDSGNNPKNIANSIFEQINKGNYEEAIFLFEKRSYVPMQLKSYLNTSDMVTIFKYEKRGEYKIEDIINHDNYQDDYSAMYDYNKAVEIKYSYINRGNTKYKSFMFVKIGGKWGILAPSGLNLML